MIPGAAARERWAAESMTGWGVRLGLHLVKGIGEEQEARLDAELARGPYTSLADVVERTGLAEEVVERLIRVGALDSLGRPRRELLWQLREVAGATKGRVDGEGARRRRGSPGPPGRPMDLRLPATEAPPLPAAHRAGAAGRRLRGGGPRRAAPGGVAVPGRARPAGGGAERGARGACGRGRCGIGGLVVTRQHPMTARGTVFLALEDETGMVNVTLWPDTWQRLRSVVRRHALLLVDGDLQREGERRQRDRARSVRPLVEAASDGRRPGVTGRRAADRAGGDAAAGLGRVPVGGQRLQAVRA